MFWLGDGGQKSLAPEENWNFKTEHSLEKIGKNKAHFWQNWCKNWNLQNGSCLLDVHFIGQLNKYLVLKGTAKTFKIELWNMNPTFRIDCPMVFKEEVTRWYHPVCG